jgi:ribonuclease HII
MILPTLDFEQELWNSGYSLICGIDEVGRGCFAGPVVAGAVIFSPEIVPPQGIADSKLLKAEKREVLADEIKKTAFCWAVGEVSVEVINKVGIGKATHLAYQAAIANLCHKPDFFIIDAFYMDGIKKDIQKPIKDGDKLATSIAAASIIAKVYRDNLMVELSKAFPQYGMAKHKGYGTKQHREAIKQHGLCELHRTSFDLSRFL